MRNSTAAAVPDPRRRDTLVRWSGRATRRAAPGPHKQLQRALRLADHSRISRYKSGDEHSPAMRSLVYIRQLAEGKHTSPWPQIVEEMVVAKHAEFEGVETKVLEGRLRELIQSEHERQAHQDRGLMLAALTHDYSGVPEAVLPHADVLVEIAALAEEIGNRKEGA